MSDNLAYREDFREELINGKVVAMSPRPVWRHVCAAGNLYRIFANYVSGKRCTAIPDGFDLHLTEDNTFVPDMMIVCDRDKIKDKGVFGAPDLVVEVLSPSTAKNDRWTKKSVYESAGVPEYWIVDPVNQIIEIFLLQDGKYVLDNICTCLPPDDMAELTDNEKADLVTECKCHLYDDLVIRLEDVFSDLL